jgi:hypothetical protein
MLLSNPKRLLAFFNKEEDSQKNFIEKERKSNESNRFD